LVAAFDDLERDHISDNAHEVVEGTEDLVDHAMAGRGVVADMGVVHWCTCDVAHRCHLGHHDRGSDLVESTVVRSSMHLMRVHNGRSMVDGMVNHRGSVVDYWGSVVDHVG